MSDGIIRDDDFINLDLTDDLRSCCVKKGQTLPYQAGQLVITNCCYQLQVFDPKKPTCESLRPLISRKTGEIKQYNECGQSLYKAGVVCECTSCNLTCGVQHMCKSCGEASCSFCFGEGGEVCLCCQDLPVAKRVDPTVIPTVQVREANLEHFKGFKNIYSRLCATAKLRPLKPDSTEEEKTPAPKLEGTVYPTQLP